MVSRFSRCFLIMILCVASFIPQIIYAAGTIQILDFPNQISTTVNQKFSTYINFIYSGDHANELGVSVIGSSLPEGISLGSIIHNKNGVNGISLQGTPSQVGGYTLTLLVSDNNGALMLTKPFLFQVNDIAHVIIPDAIVNKSYSQNLFIANYNQGGSDDLIVNFSILNPDKTANFNDILIQSIHSKINNGYVTLNLMPLKRGSFIIKAEVVDSEGKFTDARIFNLNVKDNSVNLSENVPLITSQSTTSSKKKEIEKSNQSGNIEPENIQDKVTSEKEVAILEVTNEAKNNVEEKRINFFSKTFSSIFNFIKNIWPGKR